MAAVAAPNPGAPTAALTTAAPTARASTAAPSLARAPATAITRPPEVFVPLATCQRACSPSGPAYATAESALDDVANGSSFSVYSPTGTHILKLPSLFVMFCPTVFPVFLSTSANLDSGAPLTFEICNVPTDLGELRHRFCRTQVATAGFQSLWPLTVELPCRRRCNFPAARTSTL
jgi:hypothetical protein